MSSATLRAPGGSDATRRRRATPYHVIRLTYSAGRGGVDQMIRSFRDRTTERRWVGRFVKRFSGIEKQALRKLDMLHTARDL